MGPALEVDNSVTVFHFYISEINVTDEDISLAYIILMLGDISYTVYTAGRKNCGTYEFLSESSAQSWRKLVLNFADKIV